MAVVGQGRAVTPPLSLDPMAQAVSEARRYVRRTLRALGAAELEESAELGVSELVTNAVLHARTAFTVAIRQMPSGRLRIEVTDRSPAAPRQQHFRLMSTTGRGLRLIESVSTAWGVEPLAPEIGPGKVVWFEPRETMSADAVAEADWKIDVDGLL